MKPDHMMLYAVALSALVLGLALAGVSADTLLIGLIVLACPLMMLLMMGGPHGGHSAGGQHDHEQEHEHHHGPTRPQS